MSHYQRQVLTARDIMTPSVITISPETEIHEAIAVLVGRKISGAPVVDGKGDLVGVLSGKDCLRVLAGDSFFDDLGGQVREFMTAEVDTITPDTDIFSIAGRFLHNPYRRLPVCKGPKVVGIVSRGDVLEGIQQMQKQLTPSMYPDYRKPSAPEKG